MKNAANAFAPSGVCWVASSGITGGFSPGRVFGPVVGTSAGTVGRVGRGGPAKDDDGGGAGVLLETEAGELGAAVLDVIGAPTEDDVHATQPAAANAAIVQIPRTVT
jgi:hypothetical protein